MPSARQVTGIVAGGRTPPALVTSNPARVLALTGAIAREGTFVSEVFFWTWRPITFLVWGGVFETFPRLKVAIVEAGVGWMLRQPPEQPEMILAVSGALEHTAGILFAVLVLLCSLGRTGLGDERHARRKKTRKARHED